jgi:recombination protein RecR
VGRTKSVDALIKELEKMPGVGPKTAERLAFYILSLPREEAKALALGIMRVKDNIGFCRICNNLSEEEICSLCQDERRDRSVICVVEEPKDVSSIEETGVFKGLYHVLLGALSPLDGIGPNEIKVKDLLSRLKSDKIKEVVIATDLDTEGETTALYLAELIKPTGLKVTRIAYGIPVGSSLEYIDQATLAKALDGRREV